MVYLRKLVISILILLIITGCNKQTIEHKTTIKDLVIYLKLDNDYCWAFKDNQFLLYEDRVEYNETVDNIQSFSCIENNQYQIVCDKHVYIIEYKDNNRTTIKIKIDDQSFEEYKIISNKKPELEDTYEETIKDIIYDKEAIKDLLEGNIEFDNDVIKTTGLKYFAFIYTLDESNALWREEWWGPGTFKEGYFYVKNMFTGHVKQLLNKPIDKFFMKDEDLDSEDTWYYFAYNNNIYKVNNDGNQLKRIYVGKNLKEDLIDMSNDQYLVFYDDGVVKTINIVNFEIQEHFKVDGIEDYIRYFGKTKTIVYKVNKTYYVYYISTNITEEIDYDKIPGLF